MLMHIHVNYRFQTLNKKSMSMWIALAFFMLVGVLASATPSNLRETLSYSMWSWQHHTILHPHLMVVAQWQR